MRIAVASGKGGTGKTTVATNLAVTASRAGRSVGYLDCDVEEPNGALFLKPKVTETRPVYVSIPTVDPDKCDGCGKCGKICRYSAIVAINKEVLVFPELRHGCAGCWLESLGAGMKRAVPGPFPAAPSSPCPELSGGHENHTLIQQAGHAVDMSQRVIEARQEEHHARDRANPPLDLG